jgi:hypothetical protein
MNGQPANTVRELTRSERWFAIVLLLVTGHTPREIRVVLELMRVPERLRAYRQHIARKHAHE